MSNYCTKEFTLHVAAAAAWIVTEHGVGNDPGFTGDADSASWNVGSVMTSIPPNPPLWPAYDSYNGQCDATLSLGPYLVEKDFTLAVDVTITSKGSYPLWIPPTYGSVIMNASLSNLNGYSGDYGNSVSGNNSLHVTPSLTGTLPIGLSCGVRIWFVLGGINAACTSIGTLTITVADH